MAYINPFEGHLVLKEGHSKGPGRSDDRVSPISGLWLQDAPREPMSIPKFHIYSQFKDPGSKNYGTRVIEWGVYGPSGNVSWKPQRDGFQEGFS